MDDCSAMNLKSSDRLKQEIDNEQRFNFVQVSIDCRNSQKLRTARKNTSKWQK